MPTPLAVMFTMTTYGSWLRGDARGWVDHGTVYPPNQPLEHADRRRMKHPPFLFTPDQCLLAGAWIRNSLIQRLDQHILAMTVQPWHVHLLVTGSDIPPAALIKCAKDAVRWGLRLGRPIWSNGYDKRYCFDDAAVTTRLRYIQRHDERNPPPGHRSHPNG